MKHNLKVSWKLNIINVLIIISAPPVYPAQSAPPQTAAYPSVMFPQPIYMPQQYPMPVPVSKSISMKYQNQEGRQCSWLDDFLAKQFICVLILGVNVS